MGQPDDGIHASGTGSDPLGTGMDPAVYEYPPEAAVPETITVVHKDVDVTTELSIPSSAMGDLLSAYVMMRSFSWQLRLSPFSFEDFCKAMSSTHPTQLMDEIHVCVLRALSFDEIREEREEHTLDLSLLDGMTWPCYVWEILRVFGDPLAAHEWRHRKSGLRPQANLSNCVSTIPEREDPAINKALRPRMPEAEAACAGPPEPVSATVIPNSNPIDIGEKPGGISSFQNSPDFHILSRMESEEPAKTEFLERPRAPPFSPVDECDMDAHMTAAAACQGVDGPSILSIQMFTDRGPRLPHKQPEYYSLPIDLKAIILARLCENLVDCTTIRAEIDRREANGEFIAGKGGEGGAFPMMTPVQKARADAMAKEHHRSDANTDTCVLCGLGGNLLCCDRCPAAYHLRCLGEAGKNLGDDDWLCPECTVGGRGESAGLRLPVAARNQWTQPYYLLNGTVVRETLPPVKGCGQHAEELTNRVATAAFFPGSQAEEALTGATLVRNDGDDVALPSSFDAVKGSNPSPWPLEEGVVSGPEGYLNKYRNGWSAAAYAIRVTIDEAKRRKESTRMKSNGTWIPTGTCGRVTVAKHPEPLTVSKYQWVQMQGRPPGRTTVRCGKCHTCLRPSLRKGCLNPIVSRDLAADVQSNDSK